MCNRLMMARSTTIIVPLSKKIHTYLPTDTPTLYLVGKNKNSFRLKTNPVYTYVSIVELIQVQEDKKLYWPNHKTNYRIFYVWYNLKAQAFLLDDLRRSQVMQITLDWQCLGDSRCVSGKICVQMPPFNAVIRQSFNVTFIRHTLWSGFSPDLFQLQKCEV